MPISLLDTDLYKLTMQQAVLRHFPDVQATYRFTHRGKDAIFTRKCVEELQDAVNGFSQVELSEPELEWLRITCPFLKQSYLAYLSTFRFDPSQVRITFVPSLTGETGNIEIEVVGPWRETILWEVPLMACLSETYYRVVVTDWSDEGQAETAYSKAQVLLNAGCVFSEFGTRRRRSFLIHDLVLENILRAYRDIPNKGKFVGTSNTYLAYKHGLKPVGTIAHEWFMGVAALKGYKDANMRALDLWEEVYPGEPFFALTDTFTTKAFFQGFATNPDRIPCWHGLRQDSGDPFAFAPQVQQLYQSLGIDSQGKAIIYSDGLDVTKCLELQRQCETLGFQASFGIGTSLTNDFYTASSCKSMKSKALNIVIKLAAVDNQLCVKISDDPLKSTGDSMMVNKVKELLNVM